MQVENGTFNVYNHISFLTRSQRPNGMIVLGRKEKEIILKRQLLWNLEKKNNNNKIGRKCCYQESTREWTGDGGEEEMTGERDGAVEEEYSSPSSS